MKKIERTDSMQGIELKVPLHESSSITIKLDGPLFTFSGERTDQTACRNLQEDAVENREGKYEGNCSNAEGVFRLQNLRTWFCSWNTKAIAGITAVAAMAFVLGILVTGRPNPFQEYTGEVSQPVERFAEQSEESIQNDALRITNGILEGQLTEKKAMELLKALDVLRSMSKSTVPGGELPDIPEDTMDILEQNGLLDAFVEAESSSMNSNQKTIRIPEKILEIYRNENGIASIPDRNYWALTGGRINLPLPGGGNVESAESFKEFGLKF